MPFSGTHRIAIRRGTGGRHITGAELSSAVSTQKLVPFLGNKRAMGDVSRRTSTGSVFLGTKSHRSVPMTKTFAHFDLMFSYLTSPTFSNPVFSSFDGPDGKIFSYDIAYLTMANPLHPHPLCT